MCVCEVHVRISVGAYVSVKCPHVQVSVRISVCVPISVWYEKHEYVCNLLTRPTPFSQMVCSYSIYSYTMLCTLINIHRYNHTGTHYLHPVIGN